MYESPIHVYIHRTMQDLNEAMWEEAWKETWRLNIRIDRDELIKALKYDRNQYENGYDDGRAEATALIRKLERERDAAVRDMYEAQGLLCLICKNHSPDPELKKYVCKEFGERYPEDGIIRCGKFEWRGVKEDDHAQTD